MKSSLILVIQILLFSVSFTIGSSPWPQRFHDIQFSNRASLNISSTTKYCPQEFPVSGNLLLLPTSDSILIQESDQTQELFNTLNLKQINGWQFLNVFAASDYGNTLYYSISEPGVPQFKIGAMTITSIPIFQFTFQGNFVNAYFNNISSTIEVVTQLNETEYSLAHISQNGVQWELFFEANSLQLLGVSPTTSSLFVEAYNTSKTNLYAIDESDGSVVWSQNRISTPTPIESSIVSDNGVLIISYSANTFYVVEAYSSAPGINNDPFLWGTFITTDTPIKFSLLDIPSGEGGDEPVVLLYSEKNIQENPTSTLIVLLDLTGSQEFSVSLSSYSADNLITVGPTSAVVSSLTNAQAYLINFGNTPRPVVTSLLKSTGSYNITSGNGTSLYGNSLSSSNVLTPIKLVACQ